MERYICVHGHFYQPPRENPWLESIELQDSAYPYHDWNERITAECYAPNAASRILDGRGRIVEIVNNYRHISFDFGPTLLAWLEPRAPDTYGSILQADEQSRQDHGGHGSALAQPYHHTILPLSSSRDKRTQVIWGLRDFEHRFRRRAEGMWLPETAVDIESLELLSEFGIRFTVLGPHQVRRWRPAGSEAWQDVAGGKIDVRRPYLQRLPSGRSMAIYFYDDPISRAVAFEGLLRSGERFAARLQEGFSAAADGAQLVHIATDGETYGHHHRHGDMALSYALRHIQAQGQARFTNYAEHLERHPPADEVEIAENTSWSCAHGLERWRSDCGCFTGGQPGWSQAWRTPLREALDWLRDSLAPRYQSVAAPLLRDPWAARDDYVDFVLDRSTPSLERFLEKHATRRLSAQEAIAALKLLELQRHAMLMYTSCGWFFNEISGIETVQVLQYAGRAIQLARELLGEDPKPRFLQLLERARSNLPERGNGRRIYQELVQPAIVDLIKVGAHYAVSSLFQDGPRKERVYCYAVEVQDYTSRQAGHAKVALGRACVTSEITRERGDLTFGALHFGDHNVNAGVREFQGQEAYQTVLRDVMDSFGRADFATVLRALDRHFRGSTYSLKSLFRDEQRMVLERVLESTLAAAEASYSQIYEHHAPLMQFLAELDIPLPKPLRMAADLVLNTNLIRLFTAEDPDLERIRSVLAEAAAHAVDMDAEGLGYALEGTLERLVRRFAITPANFTLLEKLEALAELVRSLPFEVDLWQVQNDFYTLARTAYPEFSRRAQEGDDTARAWVKHFTSLGEKLAVAVE